MAEETGKAGHITTNDGVWLHYVEAGAGRPVVMIPGWSQPATQFKYQLAGLHDRYRLIALDMRGHGESEKPAFGYKIARLAKDLHEVLGALDLHEVVLLGHSMGCAVIWSYWELFGAERLATLWARIGAVAVVAALALLDGADDLTVGEGQMRVALQVLGRKGREDRAEGGHGRSPCMRVWRRS